MRNISQQFLIEFLNVYYRNENIEKLNSYFKQLEHGRLTKQLLSEGVLPFFFDVIISGKVGLKLPDDLYKQWRQYAFQLGAVNAMHEKAAIEVLEMFKASGIPCIVLKGFSIIERLYDNKWTRITGDVDLLIHREDYVLTKGMLLDKGFKCVTYNEKEQDEEHYIKLSEENRGEMHFQKDTGFLSINIDLHWETMDFTIGPVYKNLFAKGKNRWFDNSEKIKLEDKEFTCLSIEMQFIQSIFHYAIQHHFSGLKSLIDICQFIKRYGYQMDWKLINETLRVENAKKVVGVCLKLACEVVGCNLIPRDIYQYWISATKFLPGEYYFYKRQAFRLDGADAMLLKHFCLLLLPCTFRDRWRVLIYFLFDNDVIFRLGIHSDNKLIAGIKQISTLFKVGMSDILRKAKGM